jgi:hypothetical protein
MCMAEARFDNLGSRILHAARMAVAVHLSTVAESQGDRFGGHGRVVIGRAGPQVAEASDSPVTDLSTDGSALPADRDRRRTGHRRLDFGGPFDTRRSCGAEGAD